MSRNSFDKAVENITKLLHSDMYHLASEQEHPMGNPDASDALMKQLKARITNLQCLRRDLEQAMTGVIV